MHHNYHQNKGYASILYVAVLHTLCCYTRTLFLGTKSKIYPSSKYSSYLNLSQLLKRPSLFPWPLRWNPSRAFLLECCLQVQWAKIIVRWSLLSGIHTWYSHLEFTPGIHTCCSYLEFPYSLIPLSICWTKQLEKWRMLLRRLSFNAHCFPAGMLSSSLLGQSSHVRSTVRLSMERSTEWGIYIILKQTLQPHLSLDRWGPWLTSWLQSRETPWDNPRSLDQDDWSSETSGDQPPWETDTYMWTCLILSVSVSLLTHTWNICIQNVPK